MNKSLIWSAAGLLIALVLCVAHGAIAPSRLRSNTEALQVMPVDLGLLSPGETRQFKLLLRNTGVRPVGLLPPESDCGCIYQEASKPLTVPSEGAIEIPFSLRAPPWPGDLSKKITLLAGASPGVSWQVPVTARVVAKAWAVPSSLQLSYDQAAILEPSVVLYHDEQTRISAVISSSPAIIVEIDRHHPNLVQVDLTIRPPPMKCGGTWEQTLQVFEENHKSELLRIPVRIARPPAARKQQLCPLIPLCVLPAFRPGVHHAPQLRQTFPDTAGGSGR